MTVQLENDLRLLGEWIARTGGSHGPMGRNRHQPCALLTEHLEAAQRYLLANSISEYSGCLTDAKSSLSCLAVKEERARARSAILELIRNVPARFIRNGQRRA